MRQEKKFILFFFMIMACGLLFFSLNRYRFYQDYIAIKLDNAGIEKSNITPDPVLSDTGKKESAQAQKININSADLETLMELPGVGREIALRIIEYRTRNGSFKDADALLDIKGIGIKKLEMIRELVTF